MDQELCKSDGDMGLGDFRSPVWFWAEPWQRVWGQSPQKQ